MHETTLWSHGEKVAVFMTPWVVPPYGLYWGDRFFTLRVQDTDPVRSISTFSYQEEACFHLLDDWKVQE